MITVHHLNNSRSQRVLWLLEELGLEYEVKRYQRNAQTMLAPPELRAVHPLGKSPVIVDGDLVLAESGAIIETLADRYGAGKLAPAFGSKERVRYLYWLHFAEGTAYLSIDRHRNDYRAPYVFKTTDYGETWQSLVNNLPPAGPVHVIRADARNRNLLYVGTEFGLFLSLDGGASWQRQTHGLPTVPVHDVVVHPRDRELVIGTHGRGIYIMDVAPLQELTAKVLETGDGKLRMSLRAVKDDEERADFDGYREQSSAARLGTFADLLKKK